MMWGKVVPHALLDMWTAAPILKCSQTALRLCVFSPLPESSFWVYMPEKHTQESCTTGYHSFGEVGVGGNYSVRCSGSKQRRHMVDTRTPCILSSREKQWTPVRLRTQRPVTSNRTTWKQIYANYHLCKLITHSHKAAPLYFIRTPTYSKTYIKNIRVNPEYPMQY